MRFEGANGSYRRRSSMAWARGLARALPLVAAVLGAPAATAQDLDQGRTVAITFDDLPYAGSIAEGDDALSPDEVARLNSRVLETLRRYSAPATGFVVQRSTEAVGDRAGPILRAWTVGDFSLGNHSYSHADVNTLDLAGIEQEIVQGESSIRALMEEADKPLQFMRFPMNHTGDTAEKREGIQTLLERLGYVAAASTIDTSDYVFERAYRAALRRSDETCAGVIRQSYLQHSAIQIDYYADLSATVLGYAPPEIALLHLNRLNADTLGELLELYLSRGYRFVTLEQAHADPAFGGKGTFVSRHGPMWAYRWARERGVRVNGAEEAEPPEWLDRYAEGAEAPCGEGITGQSSVRGDW